MKQPPSVIDQLPPLLMEMARMMRKKLIFDSETKFNPLQFHALMVIRERGGITMKEFADALHITSPSATSFADRLVKLKWVRRRQDASNRKLVRLELTPAGGSMIASAMTHHAAVMRDIFSRLSDKDQRELVRILQHLHSSFSHS